MRIRFVQGIIDKIKNAVKQKTLKKYNTIEIAPDITKNVVLKIDGKNNTVILKNYACKGARVVIKIYGNNNKVVIDKGGFISNSLSVVMGQNRKGFCAIHNSELTIGENTTIESMNYTTFNSNTYCKIGKNCMISFDVNIFNTDAHPIFDINTKEIVNKVTGIEIGDHCWIGKNAEILKNSKLAEDCILGWRGVLAGNKSQKKHCVYAGNPAKLVKENVTWDTDGVRCGYIDNIIEKSEVNI